MRAVGSGKRWGFAPETDEERQFCQDVLDGKAMTYWGDLEEPGWMGGGLVLSAAPALAGEPPPYVGEDPAK